MNVKQNLRRPVLSGIVIALLLLAAGGTAWFLRDRLWATPPAADPETPHAEGNSDVVELSGEKIKAANVQTVVVRRTDLLHGHTVPGRVTYDETLHVAVKTPADGVLTEVVVQPGDRVDAGAVLAWVTSREIGTARADVLDRQAQRELAVDWWKQKQTLAANVAKLAADLKQRKPFAAMQKEYATRVLGDYREKLFAAYSRFLLADALHKSLSAATQGAVAANLAMQQASERRASEAALKAACEQLTIDSRRERDVARANAVDAERRLTIARQHLASLLLTPGMISGSNSPASPGANNAARRPGDSHKSSTVPEPGRVAPRANLENLSRLAIRAPISGTIESREFTSGERVKQSDSLFVLAETSRLWVKADLRESEWSALGLAVGRKLPVTSPAFPGKTFTARLYRLGRTVSPETNSIPLIAEIDNSGGKLRPGLFVRVTLPVAEESGELFVPDSAVLQHDGKSFVFVEVGKGRYRRTDVKTGLSSGNRVAVLSGLHEGNRVVTTGAFALKSEMLLEREE